MKDRIRGILKAMTVGTYEREEVLALSLLSALAGESIFLLGLPGVGKSMVARKLKTAFEQPRVFEYLMSRFSTPDEIFGPISISKLKDSDSFERVTAGYLPEADIIFLDEIWKAGPAIQNSLLTVLNEKLFLNGNNEIELPVKAIISASNELPAEDEGLEALWDRFLIRYVVEPLKHRNSFISLINPDGKQTALSVSQPITSQEYKDIRHEINIVRIPEYIVDMICRIRDQFVERAKTKEQDELEDGLSPQLFYVSDRRWKKAIGVLKASAYLNGRSELNSSDLLLLRHMLWNDPRTKDRVDFIIVDVITKALFKDILDKFKSYRRHASNESADKRLYIHENKYYIVLCDGDSLKLKISDYNMLKESRQVYFGSEMSDGSMRVREHGQFALQVAKEGFVSINSYAYPLKTNSDKQLAEDFLQDFGDKLESLSRDILKNINANLFLTNSDIGSILGKHIDMYKKRFEDC